MPFRNVAKPFVAAILALALAGPASGQETQQQGEWEAGGTLIGSLKYGADFKHYDHVNPDAPKGGTLSMSRTASANTAKAAGSPPATAS